MVVARGAFAGIDYICIYKLILYLLILILFYCIKTKLTLRANNPVVVTTQAGVADV